MELATLNDIQNFNIFDKYYKEFNDKKLKLLHCLDVMFDDENIDMLWDYGSSASYSSMNKSNTHLPKLDYVREFLTHDTILKMLTKEYWNKVIIESRILDYVSSSVKEEFSDALNNFTMPDFTKENVESTLRGLVKDLPSLFKQRLQDAFDVLSKTHKTNSSNMFNKRMIFNVANYSKYIMIPSDFISRKCNAIDDIRSTINQLLGGEQMTHSTTQYQLYDLAKAGRYGEWVKLDDNVAIKIFMVGTAHLEIRPEIADSLNAIIANGTIPNMTDSWYQKKEKKVNKEFHDLQNVMLSRSVLKTFEEWDRKPQYLFIDGKNPKEMKALLSYIDKDYTINDNGLVSFSYDVKPVVKTIIQMACVPDYKSYQFYPTPKEIVNELQKHIPSVGNILEPSAGTGNLIDGIDAERITFVELSQFHSSILNGKGYKGFTFDFLKCTETLLSKYECIVMNPPFSKGRALTHIDHAHKFLTDDGFILAVLPTGKIKDIKQNYSIIKTFKGVFDNTNIDTTLVKIFK